MVLDNLRQPLEEGVIRVARAAAKVSYPARVLLIHGIGGFWFDWRHQIPSLAKRFKVVAMTQRGFDKSGQPAGVEHYSAAKIASDINALIWFG